MPQSGATTATLALAVEWPTKCEPRHRPQRGAPRGIAGDNEVRAAAGRRCSAAVAADSSPRGQPPVYLMPLVQRLCPLRVFGGDDGGAGARTELRGSLPCKWRPCTRALRAHELHALWAMFSGGRACARATRIVGDVQWRSGMRTSHAHCRRCSVAVGHAHEPRALSAMFSGGRACARATLIVGVHCCVKPCTTKPGNHTRLHSKQPRVLKRPQAG